MVNPPAPPGVEYPLVLGGGVGVYGGGAAEAETGSCLRKRCESLNVNNMLGGNRLLAGGKNETTHTHE
jgi:hypothetical protein